MIFTPTAYLLTQWAKNNSLINRKNSIQKLWSLRVFIISSSFFSNLFLSKKMILNL